MVWGRALRVLSYASDLSSSASKMNEATDGPVQRFIVLPRTVHHSADSSGPLPQQHAILRTIGSSEVIHILTVTSGQSAVLGPEHRNGIYRDRVRSDIAPVN